MPTKENPSVGVDNPIPCKKSIRPEHPKCGAPLTTAGPSEGYAIPEEDAWDDEFICPACCCGIYIELPEERGQSGKADKKIEQRLMTHQKSGAS